MKNIIHSAFAPAAIGPYSQAVEANGLIYTSGQLPINPETGAFPAGIAEQTKQSLQNIKAILAEAGVGMDRGAMNAVYATFFPEGDCPARSAVEVARLPKDALVEIEAIAVR